MRGTLVTGRIDDEGSLLVGDATLSDHHRCTVIR